MNDSAEALEATEAQQAADVQETEADGTKSALATSTSTWAWLTREGLSFSVKGTQTVRYGRYSTWITKTVTGDGKCTNQYFGRDPLVGVGKLCEILKGGTTTAPTTSQATLSWTPSSSSTVTGYRVYYGTASKTYLQAAGSGISAGSSAAYTVTGLTVGKQYYFAVTSVDAAGNESSFSNEAVKVVQ